ncbi:hypothetical protein [Actinomycetospora atypica]|uniref:Glycosyltransferase RgtA/B/C/D-like domain-containing protein n=1 Tax=Actinomycetospora atypica TaxID=1290095 RepID=A0ABV9YL26_9PSEU
MTTGGTVVRSSVTHAQQPSKGQRWVDDPRLVRHLPTFLAVLVFLGCFVRIRQRWFIQGMSGFGYDTWVVQSTIDGTAIAPNQYRPLMPWVDHLVSMGTGLPLPTAILGADFALLVVTVVLLYRLSCQLGAPALLLAAAGSWAYWVAKLDHWHPEVMLLTVIVAAATTCLLNERPNAAALFALGVLACGARTDYAAGLGLVLIAVGVHRRRRPLMLVGLGVGGSAVVSTVLLAQVFYPQAAYRTAVVQLPFNLTSGSWAMVLLFYGALLVTPVLLAARRRGLPPMSFALAWFSLQFAATFVVGRVEESRIFMPFAPVLAVAAVMAWRELQSGQPPGPSSSAHLMPAHAGEGLEPIARPRGDDGRSLQPVTGAVPAGATVVLHRETG